MNPKAWTLFIVALSRSCGVPNSFKKISYTSCALSQQSAQKICTIGAQKNKSFPRQGQVADTPDITRFRFNYSIRMPTGEIGAETFATSIPPTIRFWMRGFCACPRATALSTICIRARSCVTRWEWVKTIADSRFFRP